MSTAAERDEHVMWQRHYRRLKDAHDIETEAGLRWELRAQARVAVAMHRDGKAPRPDLAAHRWRHSDAIRREFRP